jgi:FkbM family methyltransferase
MLKKIIKILVVLPIYFSNKVIEILSIFHKRFKGIGADFQLDYSDSLTETVAHTAKNGQVIRLDLYTPNSMCLYRAETFSSKEPETLDWIEEFGKNGATLFDIGANVGLYTIFHNKVNEGKCVSFEPSFFNLKLLLKNINVNNCQNLTTVITNPLSDKTNYSNFSYGSTVEGGALSAFDVNFGYDGQEIQSDMTLNVLGMSLDWMFENGLIKDIPNLVKIDVDGIEHIILKGSEKILTHKDCLTVLIEVNDNFIEQADNVESLLSNYGFSLRNKLQAEFISNSKLFSTTYNQIWVKSSYL